MSKFESNPVNITLSDADVFNFLSDFNNFSKLMPSQVTDWKSDGESCSFTIQNMAVLGMRYKTKTPHHHIFIVSDGKVPFEFDLQVYLHKIGDAACSAKLEFNADLNPMMMMIASKPLANFINLLAEKLKEVCESGQV